MPFYINTSQWLPFHHWSLSSVTSRMGLLHKMALPWRCFGGWSGQELLGPCLWPAVGSRSTCCSLLSSCEGVTTPLCIWGAPPTSCGRAVNHSIPISPPYSELDTWPRPDNHNTMSLHTWGLNQDTGFGSKVLWWGPIKVPHQSFPSWNGRGSSLLSSCLEVVSAEAWGRRQPSTQLGRECHERDWSQAEMEVRKRETQESERASLLS